MANVFAIHSVGASLVALLGNAYPLALKQKFNCEFRLLSSGELNGHDEIDQAMTLYLYRVTVDEHLRNARGRNSDGRDGFPLVVNLHYMLTSWFKSALAEQVVLGWAVSQLKARPVLDGSLLSPEAAWGPDEVVQLMPVDLGNEELMRIWDAFEPKYRLSVLYVARVVRIDADVLPDSLPVVATRFDLGPAPAEVAP